MNIFNPWGLVGSFVGGALLSGLGAAWAVNAHHNAKDYKGQLGRADATIEAMRSSVQLSKENRESADRLRGDIAEILAGFMLDLGDMTLQNNSVLNDRFDRLAALANEVEKLRDLPNLDPCALVPFDDRLLDWAFEDIAPDRSAGVPIPGQYQNPD